MTIDTTMNIALSATLQGTLGHSGVFAYALYFDAANTAHWTPLVDNGTIETAPSITWTEPYVSGKVYFIVQSLATATSDLQTKITTPSELTWGNATHYDFRYDSFELTLSNNSADQGNLTSVNGFGIPMSVAIPGVGSRGYDVSGSTMFSDVTGVSAAGQQHFTYSAGPLASPPAADGQRMVLSPTEALGQGLPAFATANWNSYVTALEGHASDVVISGWFNGAPTGPKGAEVWHNAGFYSYQLSWDGTYFWLSPMENSQNPAASSQIQGYIRIDPADLENSIYSTLGNANVYLNKTDATPYFANMNTGTNNQWGEIFTQFLTGFTGGYYGGTGNAQALNPLLHATVNLNNTSNWDPTYAFNNNGTNSLTSGFTGSNNKYDPYAELFFQHSNSYGAGYSDNLMKAYAAGGPLISLWDSGAAANVSTINVTLNDDSEIPAGYTAPVIYNYLAPAPGGYAAPVQFVGDGLNIVLSFINGSMVLKDGTPVTIGFYSGGPSGTFNTVTVPTNGPGNTIFQNWNLNYDPAHGTYSLKPYGPQGVLTPGSILLNQFPVAASGTGGITWNEITVGSGAAAKTFDLYVTSESTGGNPAYAFVNPAQPGHATAIQIDGLATVSATAGNATVGTFTANFLGASYSLDPSLLTRVTDQTIINDPQNGSFPQPDAPVVGMLKSGVFAQLAAPGSNDPTVSSGALAFGWNGADSTQHNDVAKYTNKIAALDVAHVVFTGSAAPAPLHGVADLDGNWTTTHAAQFGDGTYTATMTEFLKGDLTFSTPVEKASAVQAFVVALDSLPLHATSGGDGLQLDQGGSSGNWIRLETIHSTLPNGTLLVYATDANGNLVDRDGHTGPGVTLDDATMAQIGSVASDSGTVLFSGGQSVYLPVGQQMHFAIEFGNDAVERLTGVKISGAGSLSVAVSGSSGELHLTAHVDNTLSPSAALAGSQRLDDQAWVYLTQGSTVQVEVAGSADNVNTAHFVRIDVDPASGAWSVGGVAYGNTDAFRGAVQQNWDKAFSDQNGGGTFHDAANWTVAGKSGFYAPVLATQNGDIFVIGNANVDGRDHIRSYGENVFGFEDLRADQHSDFDYNDMIVKLTVH
jgi:hypothetical protein